MKRAMIAVLALLLSVLSIPAIPDQASASSRILRADLPALIEVAPEVTEPRYDRNRFEHWIDADGNDCNTRYEVLIAQSLEHVAVDANCKPAGGLWVSPYDGFTTSDYSKIEIDHVVALSEAWKSGAWSWSDNERKAFANDLGVPYALVGSSSVANRSKSDSDPAQWLPIEDDYVCEYVTNWTLVKYRWSLTADPVEHAAIQEHLRAPSCANTSIELPEVMTGATPPAPQPTAPALPVQTPAPVHKTVIKPVSSGVTRLSGNDRYSTAIAVSKQFESNVPVVFVATGNDFPDALSAAAAAASLGGPLLLTPRNALPEIVLDEVRRLKPRHIYVVGGTGVVSQNVVNKLRTITTVERLSGADRYSTGEAIVKEAFEGTTPTTAFIATGRGFADALAASGAAGSVDAPVILVDGDQRVLRASTRSLLEQLGTRQIVLVGGTGVVSLSIENQLKNSGYSVKRYGGSDRFATAARVNAPYFSASATQTVFISTGMNFPDALAGAALAGQIGAPLYVSMATCTPSDIHNAIKKVNPRSTVALGGPSVLSNAATKNTKCVPPPVAKPPVVKPPAPKPPATKPPVKVVAGAVSPGAFCKRALADQFGRTSTGLLMKCTTSSTDSRLRWRQA